MVMGAEEDAGNTIKLANAPQEKGRGLRRLSSSEKKRKKTRNKEQKRPHFTSEYTFHLILRVFFSSLACCDFSIYLVPGTRYKFFSLLWFFVSSTFVIAFSIRYISFVLRCTCPPPRRYQTTELVCVSRGKEASVRADPVLGVVG